MIKDHFSIRNFSSSRITFILLVKATEELRERIGNLKVTYGSRVKALNDITGELEGNFQSTFGDINSEVSKHSSALENVSIFIPSILVHELSPLSCSDWIDLGRFSFLMELLQRPRHCSVISKIAFTNRKRS